MFAHSRSFSAEPFPDLEGRFELGSLGAADSDKAAQLLNGRGVHSSQPFVAVQQPPRQFLRAHARRPRPQDDCKKLCGSKRFGANRLKEGSRLLFLDPLSYRKTSFLLRGHPMKEGPQSPLLPGRAIPSALLLPPAGPPVDLSSSVCEFVPLVTAFAIFDPTIVSSSKDRARSTRPRAPSRRRLQRSHGSAGHRTPAVFSAQHVRLRLHL